jgi:hypothetical protein
MAGPSAKTQRGLVAGRRKHADQNPYRCCTGHSPGLHGDIENAWRKKWHKLALAGNFLEGLSCHPALAEGDVSGVQVFKASSFVSVRFVDLMRDFDSNRIAMDGAPDRRDHECADPWPSEGFSLFVGQNHARGTRDADPECSSFILKIAGCLRETGLVQNGVGRRAATRTQTIPVTG